MVTLDTQPPKITREGVPPPLKDGDRLDADEFLRRYDAMPDLKKAELIQGTVHIMASPVYIEQHGEPDSFVQGWLFSYAIATPGTKSAVNATTKLGPKDVPQPDGLLRILPEFGGQTRVEKNLLVGAPELGFEVAASSASIDANAKKDSYLDSGMREYVLWRTRSGKIDWWKLENGEFTEIEPGEDGILRSEVFPGLWLDPAAMVEENGARVMEVLQQGLASPEHTAFVKTLAKRAST